MRIHSRAIIYFDMVRRCGSVRQASRRLNVSASAVNRQLLYLEGEVSAAGAALHAIVPTADADVAAAQFEASIPLIKNEISDRDGLGRFDRKLLQATWVWVAKSFNYAVEKVDPETLVDRSFAPGP